MHDWIATKGIYLFKHPPKLRTQSHISALSYKFLPRTLKTLNGLFIIPVQNSNSHHAHQIAERNKCRNLLCPMDLVLRGQQVPTSRMYDLGKRTRSTSYTLKRWNIICRPFHNTFCFPIIQSSKDAVSISQYPYISKQKRTRFAVYARTWQ
jgi:hypothetical protein